MAESGSSAADSYIGSLISLTSKSEIRYEGILYTVDTENSNIALQNVRSFGTEGRKKEGPQIPASDKIYDYIIFRGSDIKDLQVKSSPPVQAQPQQPHNDPAIISLQTHQAQQSQASTVAPSYLPSPAGLPTDTSATSLPYTGIPPTAFRGTMPSMYQPAVGVGSWGPPLPPPGQNGAGLGMPMYWQGYYRPPSGQMHMQHQPLPLQPPPLPHAHLQAHSQLQPLQQLSSQPQLPTQPQVLPQMPIQHSAQLQHQSILQSQQAQLQGPPSPHSQITSPSQTSLISSTALVTPSGIVPSMPMSSVPLPSVPSAPPQMLPAASTPSVVSVTPLATSSAVSSLQLVGAPTMPAVKAPRRDLLVHPSQLQPQQSVGTSPVISSASVSSVSSQPITMPGSQAKNPITNILASKEDGKSSSFQSTTEQIGSQLLQQIPSTQPLLPLPTSSTSARPLQVNGGATIPMNYNRRGRGRGIGNGRGSGVGHSSAQRFTEDFDFTAMNEKFNKDEVWGELGKVELRGDEEEEPMDGQSDDNASDGVFVKPYQDASKKTVYVKDDFFDSLSCDALDREGGRTERTKFSEQRKIDTETFGNFSLRSRGGRGGRNGGRRGGYRGGYYGGYNGGGSRGGMYYRGRGGRSGMF